MLCFPTTKPASGVRALLMFLSTTITGSKVDPIKISCVKQRVIFSVIDEVIGELFNECPEPTQGAESIQQSNKEEKKQILDICDQYYQIYKNTRNDRVFISLFFFVGKMGAVVCKYSGI